MQKYYAHTDFISTDAKDFEFYVEVYLANHVDCLPLAEVMETQAQRIAELEKGLAAAFKWLHRNVLEDVRAREMPKPEDGFSAEYLNDLADMRAARSE